MKIENRWKRYKWKEKVITYLIYLFCKFDMILYQLCSMFLIHLFCVFGLAFSNSIAFQLVLTLLMKFLILLLNSFVLLRFVLTSNKYSWYSLSIFIVCSVVNKSTNPSVPSNNSSIILKNDWKNICKVKHWFDTHSCNFFLTLRQVFWSDKSLNLNLSTLI